MAYTRTAVERAMEVQEAILRALSGRQSWLQVMLALAFEGNEHILASVRYFVRAA